MKKLLFTFLPAIAVFAPYFSFAQQGIHGPRTVTAANTIVNEYTSITALVSAGSTTIPVANSALNANGRFAASLQPGDLVMLIQVQGTIIRDLGSAPNPDTAWGRIDPGNYYSTGLYEFRQVVSVPNATTIVIDCGTTNTYIPNGGTARKPMVVRVPRYTTLTINAGASLSCDDWNGTTGGVLAVEVQGNTIINGTIDVNGKGFRGGSLVGDNNTTFGSNSNASTNSADGAEKGESVAGYQSEYDAFGGRYSRAAPANGGGGGSGHNGGGGGGANGPNSTSSSAVYSGLGIPDQTGVGWTAAWNLEAPVNTMSLRTAANSSGGGRGGYTFSGSNGNATTQGPDNAANWGGDARRSNGTGLGGRVLDYNTVAAQGYPRVFMGGGGGAGDQNNSGGGVGGDGGGIVYLLSYGTVSGSGTINANGLNGANATGGTGIITGIDGAGGGGGGGAVIVNSVGAISNTITINANGGNGGNQVVNLPFSSNEGEGPGGGGGGGYIAISNGTPTRNTNGGVNGTTNSGGLTEFTPNGATKGCPGTNNASIPYFDFSINNITICSGNSVTLTVSPVGTLPPGAVYNWYTTAVGGSPFFTGTSYTTPALTTTTTYWVGTCPGWWREQVTVTVGPAPVVTASATTNPICSGSSTTLTASGATTYNWMPGNLSGSSISVSPATTTSYTVTGSTGPGCSGSTIITVTVTPTPTVTATAGSSSICAGNSTTLTGSGATSYTWNPGALSGSPVTVSPATTTTYTVTGTTSGCSGTAQVTVTVNPSPTVTATATSTTICAGNSTTLNASGATSYTWNPGALSGSSVSVSPASTTTYTVTGTAAGCSSQAQVTVTVNPLPTVTATAGSSTICAGNSTTLTGSGATTYTWNPGALSGSPVTVTPAATTTYTVTGTTSGCSNTAQVTVTVNPTPTVTATATSTTICPGDPTTLNASGATTYTWNPGALSGSSVTVNPTTTTTYTLTGTTSGCSSTAQVTITVNPAPTITASASSPTICIGSSTTLNASGATSYTWNPGALNGASVSVSPTASTTYTVTGTTSGCSSTAQVVVTVNPSPTITATAGAAAICTGSSTTLTGSGATNYSWNPGSINGNNVSVSPTATTTYTVIGTDGNGCADTTQVTVTVSPLPTPTVTATPTAVCIGQSVALAASGGTTYSWNGGSFTNTSGASQTDSPTTTTTYTVDVTDANTCSASAQVTVTVNPLPVANAGSDQTVCSGTTVTLNATGGTGYSWNGGSLSNASGASQSDVPGTTTSYTVTVTDANGCSNNDTVTVNVNATPVTNAGPDVSICPNSSIQLNATGANTYSWSPAAGLDNPSVGNPNASPVATTTYVVTGTAANGCSSNDTIVVAISNNLTVFAGPDLTICSGDTTTLTTSGGTTYSWSPAGSLGNASGASTPAFPTTTTTYTVLVTDANNCQGSDTITVFVNGPVNLTTGGATTICIGQSANITATPSNGAAPYSYTWSNSLPDSNTQTVSPTVSTTYSVTVTDSLGCSSPMQTVTVNVNPPLTLSATTATICQGGTANISATGTGGDGNYTYNWLPGPLSGASVSVTPANTTTYTVIVTDGCGTPPDTATTTVTVAPSPTVTVTSNVVSGCAPLCVNFTGQSTGNCASESWTFGDGNNSTQSSPSNCYVNAGTYDIVYTCTDANGCSGTVTMNSMITVNPQPVAAFSSSAANNTVLVTPGNPQQVCFTDNSTSATSWNWTFDTNSSSQQNPCFAVSDTGTYCAALIATSAGGCADTAELCILAVSEATFTIPNVFTPNADGTNDLFLITSSGVKDFHCEIYDRWGVKIYEWNSVTAGWDGRTTSGMMAVDGVYYYVMQITDYADKTSDVKGFVHLIRGGQ